LPDASGTILTSSGTQAASFGSLTVNGNNISAVNSLGFRNRIINGDMRIDQRNAGASISVSTDTGIYSVDRFKVAANGGGVFSAQRSTTVPVGFTNSLLITVTTADASIAAGDYYQVQQRIEGFNVADFGLGTASAINFTVSFWVRSSLTGTFGGSLYNSAANRSYPFTYVVSAANTWEQKTFTVAGDTSGTWTTDNTAGLTLNFSLGAGSTYTDSAAGSWVGSLEFGASGQINPIATNGATFYITGVQLEAGSVATPFEQIDYGRELIMCQRYFVNLNNLSGSWNFNKFGFGVGSGSSNNFIVIPTPVTLRAIPTVSYSGGFTTIGSGGTAVSSTTVDTANATGVQVTVVAGTYALGQFVFIQSGSLTLSAEL
jgi:hypothetical protein